MHQTDVEIKAQRLVSLFDKAPSVERLNMRPEVDRVIRTLKSLHHPIPGTLRRLKVALDEEAFDDLFDNMPV